MDYNKQMVMKLREISGYGLIDCKNALTKCSNIESTARYLKIKSQAVCRYKYVNGEKVKWSDKDYIDESEKVATSNILNNVVTDNKADAERLIKALEKAEDLANDIKKYPFPNRKLVDSKEWQRLFKECRLEFYGYPSEETDYYGYDNDVFQINPFYWGDCDCDIGENDEGHAEGCPVIRHNFIYKKTGFWIDWYKYPFRVADMSDSLTEKEIKSIWKDCVKSVTN